MGQKKQSPTKSQVVGIAWITALFILLAGFLFFSRRGGGEGVPNDSIKVSDIAKLARMEDSVYRSRRAHAEPRRRPQEPARAEEPLYSTEAAPARKQPLRVELNAADTTALMLLHGIGPAYAQRIVRYRERLGGFVDMSQLLEVYGFTPALLEHIAPYLLLDTLGIRKISINNIGLKALARHPYVEYYQARDIVNLRAHGVVFETEEDLRAVPSMADSTLQRLRPYLDYAPAAVGTKNTSDTQ